MADKYGMVPLMKRTYRNHDAAIRAGKRRARATGNAAYVGMLHDCRFHIADESPERDWRFDGYTACLPNSSFYVPKGGR